MSEYDIWLTLHYLHLVAMAFFVGGQIVLVAAIVPVLRGSPDPQMMRGIGMRFGIGSMVALAVLVATGVEMANRGNHWGDPTLHLKLGIVVAVLIMLLVHLRWPKLHVLSALVLIGSLVIVWLGLTLAH